MKHIVNNNKKNQHILTAGEAGQGVVENRQKLAELCEGPRVSEVTLQHRLARRQVEREVTFTGVIPTACPGAPVIPNQLGLFTHC